MTAPRFQPRAALGALLLCAVTLPLLSGCTLFNRVFHRGGKAGTACHERPFAGNADSRAPLKVPEGMSAPDTRNAVKIPTLSTPERSRAKSEPCLAQPPNFFAQPLPAPVSKPAASKRRSAPKSAPEPTPAPAPASAPPSPAPAPAPPSAPVPAPAPAAPDAAPPGDVAPPG